MTMVRAADMNANALDETKDRPVELIAQAEAGKIVVDHEAGAARCAIDCDAPCSPPDFPG
ncbi:hypothetical protein [Azospirillum endophyticum]|uniref:hypothetical protein n=1 Tax=Azospirillum endophyticum TaxID=2800326 RepID=UPI001FFFD210|nr:hypothetical protein [Azospirillum endophyticum]